MSNSPETDLGLDLQFLPAWAQKSAEPNRYANYAGESGPGDRRQDRGERRPRPRERSGPQDRQRGPSGPRKPEDRRRPDDRPRREQAPPAPLPELNVAFKPDDIGVDSLARQIKMTGRAYPLFDIAQMILQKPERHSLTISVEKKPDGQVVQPLFVCALDDTLWLSEDEAVQYVLDKHFATFYQPERTQVESFSLSGVAARNLRSQGLARLVRSAWEDQRRFPLQIATVLSQQFATHGLQFFKVNRTVTHVSVARPHYLDLDAEPVSEGVKRIVNFIDATPKCTRRKMVEALAPSPTPPPPPADAAPRAPPVVPGPSPDSHAT